VTHTVILHEPQLVEFVKFMERITSPIVVRIVERNRDTAYYDFSP